jgi:ribonuclease HI
MHLTIFTDGGTRGNPGPASSAFVVFDHEDAVLFEQSKFLPSATNNEAEYIAMISALSWVVSQLNMERLIASLVVKSDSELIVKQITGVYTAKNPTLRPLWEEAVALYEEIRALVPRFQLIHVRREQNSHADALCNACMDAKNAKFTRHVRAAQQNG